MKYIKYEIITRIYYLAVALYCIISNYKSASCYFVKNDIYLLVYLMIGRRDHTMIY